MERHGKERGWGRRNRWIAWEERDIFWKKKSGKIKKIKKRGFFEKESWGNFQRVLHGKNKEKKKRGGLEKEKKKRKVGFHQGGNV